MCHTDSPLDVLVPRYGSDNTKNSKTHFNGTRTDQNRSQDLVKPIDNIDDQMNESLQRITRLETSVDIAEKQRKLK